MTPYQSYTAPLEREARRERRLDLLTDAVLLVAACALAWLVAHLFLTTLLIITAPAPMAYGCC